MRRRKKAQPPTYDFPTGVPGRPWFGLYCGSDPNGGLFWAGPESSMLVLGPPRSGKTTSVVVPCVLDAPGAVVSTSTKPDVLAATGFWRWMVGNCYLFDPTGSTVVPTGVVPLRWSPVTGCSDFERAVATAHSLASAARPQAAVSEAAHWVERAEALLAPMLFAADRRGRDMATVCRWVLGRDLREAEAVIADAGHEMARAVLAGVAATEDRERSGIFSTASGLLAAPRRRWPAPRTRPSSPTSSCPRPTPSSSAPRRTPKSNWPRSSWPCSTRSAPPSTPGRPTPPRWSSPSTRWPASPRCPRSPPSLPDVVPEVVEVRRWSPA